MPRLPPPNSRSFNRCFAPSRSTPLWVLLFVALTTSYLGLQSFAGGGRNFFNFAFDPFLWENRVRNSAHIRRYGGLSVLVTGAAGFIGTHVSLSLRKRGDGVVGVDDFNGYYDPSLKNARKALLNSHDVFVVNGDVNDARMLAKLFEIVPFTHVLHLAAQPGAQYATEKKAPSSYIHSNIAGLLTVLEACKRSDPQPAFIWASSGSVYGSTRNLPFSESDPDPTAQSATLYAATKKAGEGFTQIYNKKYGLSITGLRLFTVYGPWGRPDMGYFSFTRNIIQGKPITIYRVKTRVSVARDFTYIDDVVKGFVAALDTAGKSTGLDSGRVKRGAAPYRVYNLGNTSPVTVPVMVGILEKHLMKAAKKNIVDLTQYGDEYEPFTHPNISLARIELGYVPVTRLDDGLEKFVRWYVSYYS